MIMQTDPLAIYRISKKGVQSTVNPSQEQVQDETEDFLNNYRIKPPEKYEFNLKDSGRVVGGLAARGVETVAGAPGGLQKGIGSLLDMIIGGGVELISGKEQPELRKFLRDPHSVLGKHREFAEEEERKSLLPGDVSSFTQYPTPEDLKENITKPLSEKLSGDENLLEPKSDIEKFFQDATKTLTELSLPGSGVHSWMGRFGLSIGAESAKELTKQLGFSASTQELAKLGTLGILSIASIGNAPRYAEQLFQHTKNMMPRGVRMNTTPLQNNLNRIRNSNWFRGHTTPSTRAAREMIDAIEARIANGNLSIHDAMTLRENINEMANSLGAFAVEGTNRTAHVAHLNEVRDALINGMEQTVGRQYPNWWRRYQEANQAFAVTRRSSAIGNFIANNYARPIVSDTGKLLFGNALAKGAAGVAKLGIAGAGIATGARAITLINRLRNPVLRRYYQRVVNASLRSDGVAMSTAIRKFDEEAIKEEKKERITKSLRKSLQK